MRNLRVVSIFTTSVMALAIIGFSPVSASNKYIESVDISSSEAVTYRSSIAENYSLQYGSADNITKVIELGTISQEVMESDEVIKDISNQLVVFDTEDFEDPVIFNDCHVTTYCNCERCCGEYAWRHTTATGAETVEGVTIAVDPRVIPYGSIVELNGHYYIAQDCGGAVEGIEIDVYIEDVGGRHTRCYEFMNDLGQDYGNTIRVWMPK